MSLAQNTFSQIQRITQSLIEVSLCNDQNCPVKSPHYAKWDTCSIVIPSRDIASALKNVEYKQLYNNMSINRNYNFRLIDGALLTLYYDFEGGEILRHTLGYYPNPNLLSFQENEDIYFRDEIYAEMIDKRTLTVPFRFDFDRRINAYMDVEHPQSHFTLGQIEKCRIPVSCPVTPCQFIHFVLRNFYNAAYNRYKDSIYWSEERFDRTISENEEKLIYISV